MSKFDLKSAVVGGIVVGAICSLTIGGLWAISNQKVETKISAAQSKNVELERKLQNLRVESNNEQRWIMDVMDVIILSDDIFNTKKFASLTGGDLQVPREKEDAFNSAVWITSRNVPERYKGYSEELSEALDEYAPKLISLDWNASDSDVYQIKKLQGDMADVMMNLYNDVYSGSGTDETLVANPKVKPKEPLAQPEKGSSVDNSPFSIPTAD